jgi:alkane 1-monooxygenase
LAGTNAAYSGTAIAHEFIHRKSPAQYLLGRILLIGICYEHYATEHVRGHHPRVGTADDPVTARFGEAHWHFIRRTVPAQFVSAWQLETKRLTGGTAPHFDARSVLRNRVLQGVLAELLLLAAIRLWLGPWALLFFVAQAATSVLMLETVNYIEHWGLSRTGKNVRPVDSWDTDNGFTLYTLVGLSRHADHHAQASRPYQRLRYHEETAKLPSGYYSTITQVLLNNRRFRELATAELQQKHLGPFAPAGAETELEEPDALAS